ncbi:helix-turn-helix domain-containing protein [Pseudonocardia kongjuensis]|uniref:TetR/AcrR family transcriptional regulator n=1 Tax=Pseudonocardia kongjuensis TaxID=102227 RepID=UPI0031E34B9A
MARKYRVGIPEAAIVDAAVRLTRSRGLHGWTMRELVAEVGTSPSVVYHRIGDRHAVCGRVVLRVLPFRDAPVPPGAHWRSWFTEVLLPLEARLREYPGVAWWILRHGVPAPGTADAADQMDAVFTMLRDAGFGDDAGLVFALLMNSVLTTIAIADDRVTSPGGGAAGHAALRQNLRDRGPDSAFGTGLGEYVDRYTGSADAAERAFVHYYRTMITTVLDGIEARLP